jgi:hypothetical protein
LRFEFSDSVLAPCNQPLVKAAVDALLTRPGMTPPDWSREELLGYYPHGAAANRRQSCSIA